jgi:hypothetical protein
MKGSASVAHRSSTVTSVALPAADLERPRERAREQERTLSAEVRIAVQRHLAERGSQEPRS